MVLARRDGEVNDTLNPKLIPDSAQVGALVELHLVGDAAGAEALVAGVLQVPAGLVLLHKLANNAPLSLGASIVIDRPPDLQVLGGIAGLVLCRTLPGDDVSAQRRKTKLEDVLGGQHGGNISSGSVNNSHPISLLARHGWAWSSRNSLFW